MQIAPIPQIQTASEHTTSQNNQNLIILKFLLLMFGFSYDIMKNLMKITNFFNFWLFSCLTIRKYMKISIWIIPLLSFETIRFFYLIKIIIKGL